ncbi:hypothetical protein JXA05_02310 [Candidatus Peregrinibacteria bacterium]|nr:hypothetical protein [Candidatus Peregrinibacteria bacterium]
MMNENPANTEKDQYLFFVALRSAKEMGADMPALLEQLDKKAPFADHARRICELAGLDEKETKEVMGTPFIESELEGLRSRVISTLYLSPLDEEDWNAYYTALIRIAESGKKVREFTRSNLPIAQQVTEICQSAGLDEAEIRASFKKGKIGELKKRLKQYWSAPTS